MKGSGEQVPKVSDGTQQLYTIALEPPRDLVPPQDKPPDGMGEFVSQEPFEVFIFKAHSRCNMACEYCFMYNAADQGWRTQPMIMSQDTIVSAAQAIDVHARTHSLEKVLAVIHGGEPLLAERAEPGFLRFLARTLRGSINAKVLIGMQTNATLLTPEILDVCSEEGIIIGVSLDGPQEINDRRRFYADGRGSHADAERGLRLLQQYRDVFGSILCVIDPFTDPIETYNYLASFDPPKIEFLLEHNNWESLPSGYKTAKEARNINFTPYADWLGAIASIWIHKPNPRIPLFEERLRLGLDLPTRLEYFGDDPVRNVITIETDGSIQGVDIYKVTEDGEPQLGLHVARNSFDDAIRHPKIRAQRLGRAGLAAQCLNCDVLKECGGGYPPHRFSKENGYKEPSVYCTDLQTLIRKTGIQLGHYLARTRDYNGLEPLIAEADRQTIEKMLGHDDNQPRNSITIALNTFTNS